MVLYGIKGPIATFTIILETPKEKPIMQEPTRLPNKTVPVTQALLALKTSSEIRKFLRDLMTPAEISAIEERWQIAQMLFHKDLSYREIASSLGASVTTVTRVARFLKDEPYKGYALALERLNDV